MEPTPDLFIEHMVEIFREVRRILRPDGTLWLNLGDSYMSHQANNKQNLGGFIGDRMRADQATNDAYVVGKPKVQGLKNKDLVGIPWMAAFAFRADGWYLRQDIIWQKPNPMPESTMDRCTKSHEYIFLLTKEDRYFYDHHAIKEPVAAATKGRYAYAFGGTKAIELAGPDGTGVGRTHVIGTRDAPDTRNKRSVWSVNTKPYKGAHFAVWPEALVEPMIKAGASEKGCCGACGAPWVRLLEEKPQVESDATYQGKNATRGKNDDQNRMLMNVRRAREAGNDHDSPFPTRQTKGWGPQCDCDSPDAVPCTVLDPFSGSGTTGKVALDLGHNYIGVDLNANYLPLAQERLLGQKVPVPTTTQTEGLDFDAL